MEKLSLAKRFIALLKNKELPFWYKLIPFVGLLYLLWPFDAISDLIPFLGQVDDAALVTGAIALFLKLAEEKVDVVSQKETVAETAKELRNGGKETELGVSDEEEND